MHAWHSSSHTGLPPPAATGPSARPGWYACPIRSMTSNNDGRSPSKRRSTATRLAIDPKPFVGDPAYDATQHLLNCHARLRSDPNGTIHRIADLLGVDHVRVGLWMFARAAAEPRDDWQNQPLTDLARVIAP